MDTWMPRVIRKDQENLWMPRVIRKDQENLPTHYDPTLDIIVKSDANSYGIGACILHNLPDGSRKAVAHASRSLLSAEKQYSQIKNEALGIIFAVTKFHRYLHGRRTINPE